MLGTLKPIMLRQLARAGYQLAKNEEVEKAWRAAEAAHKAGMAQAEKAATELPRRAPIVASELGRVCARIAAIEDDSERERKARIAMATVADDPCGAASLELVRKEHQASSICEFLIGAKWFAEGRIAQAHGIFEDLTNASPSRLAFLCLGRSSAALGDERGARAAFTHGLARCPSDPFLTLEAAASHYREGNTVLANEVAAPLRARLANDGGALSNEIANAIDAGTLSRGPGRDIYDDEFSRTVWLSYFGEFAAFSRFQNGTSWLAESTVDELKRIIRKNSVAQMINFGAFCAKSDFELAKAFPEVEFIGVDRQRVVCDLNQKAFAAPNIRYVAADIIDFLDTAQMQRNALFVHARTACLCYPDFLRLVYRKCADRDIPYIWMYEGCALSPDHIYRDFGEMPKISLPARSVMFIHDYPRLLGEAGYSVVHMRRPFQSILLDHEEDLGSVNFFLQARLS